MESSKQDKQVMTKDRLDKLLLSTGMSELMDIITLRKYSEPGYVNVKPTRQMVRVNVQDWELEELRKYIDEDYTTWYRLWQMPQDRLQLENQIIEIGSYYQRVIQHYLGMAPDLLRDDSHQIMGRVAQLTLDRVGERMSYKDYFKLRVLTNTVLPDLYKEYFKKGLRVGTSKAGQKYEQAYRNLLEKARVDFNGLDIFGFIDKVTYEGVKDPLWLDHFFKDPTFTMRTIDVEKAKMTFIQEVQIRGLKASETERRNQLMQDYIMMTTKDTRFGMITAELVGYDTIRWVGRSHNFSLLTTFGANRIVALETDLHRDIILNKADYACSLKDMGEVIKRLHTRIGKDAFLIGILVASARLVDKG